MVPGGSVKKPANAPRRCGAGVSAGSDGLAGCHRGVSFNDATVVVLEWPVGENAFAEQTLFTLTEAQVVARPLRLPHQAISLGAIAATEVAVVRSPGERRRSGLFRYRPDDLRGRDRHRRRAGADAGMAIGHAVQSSTAGCDWSGRVMPPEAA